MGRVGSCSCPSGLCLDISLPETRKSSQEAAGPELTAQCRGDPGVPGLKSTALKGPAWQHDSQTPSGCSALPTLSTYLCASGVITHTFPVITWSCTFFPLQTPVPGPNFRNAASVLPPQGLLFSSLRHPPAPAASVQSWGPAFQPAAQAVME